MGNTVYAVALQVGPQQQRSAHLLPSTTVSGFNLVLAPASTPTPDPLGTPPPGPTPTPAGYVLVKVGIWHTKVIAGPDGILITSGVCTIVQILVPAGEAGNYTDPDPCHQD